MTNRFFKTGIVTLLAIASSAVSALPAAAADATEQEGSEAARDVEQVEEQPQQPQPAEQTTVVADETEIDFKAGKAILTGNVKVTGPDMILTAREMIVYFDNNRNLTRIEAEDDVVIVQPEVKRKATSERASYDVVRGIIKLTDNPRLEMDESTLENAQSITYYRDSDRVKSEGGTISFSSQGEGEELNIFNRGQTDDSE